MEVKDMIRKENLKRYNDDYDGFFLGAECFKPGIPEMGKTRPKEDAPRETGENILGEIIRYVMNRAEQNGEDIYFGLGCGYANINDNNSDLKRFRIVEQNRKSLSPKEYRMTKPADPSKTYTL